MGRPSKENSLTLQAVVTAAIACIDAEGSAALGINRVARALRVKPPALYKHLSGKAGLERAVALTIWQQYMDWCRERVNHVKTSEDFAVDLNRDRLMMAWRATRAFALQYPSRYQVMMRFQLQPDDQEAFAIIQETQQFVAEALHMQGFSAVRLIDAMRMITATINGFIALELGKNLTLERSTDESFSVILDALMVAIEQIRDR
ncbi:MAG: TetR-like C-terminal domain-containing protein [Cyanobacteria bacterium J06633_2]